MSRERDVADVHDELRELVLALRDGRRASDANDAVTMQDLDGTIVAWSPGAERLYGYTESEAVGMNVSALLPDGTRVDTRRRLLTSPGSSSDGSDGGRSSTSLEVRRRAKDGRVLDVALTARLLVDEEGRPLAVATTERDVTARKQADIARRRLATVLHDSNDAITLQDLGGAILEWNRGAERMYGYSEAEALAMNVDVLWPEGEQERARAFRAAVVRGEGDGPLETRRRAKDGREIDVSLTVTRLMDADGNTAFIATTERDITERKRIEHEAARLVGELNDALHARDEFLSAASHELKTPLSALTLKLDLLLRQARRGGPPSVPLVAGLEVIARQASRLGRLIDELLDISRINSGRLQLEAEDVDLSQLVRDVLDRLNAAITRTRTTVELDVQPGVVGRWDRLRLEEVLASLISNAAKYGSPPLEVTVAANQSEATLVVRDHGPGIAIEEQGRIFDRFARGAIDTGGLGLGLYITRQIVEAHGGKIRVESAPGAGASFIVVLPLEPRPFEQQAEATP